MLTRLRRTAFAVALLLLSFPLLSPTAVGQGGLGGGISNPRPLTAQAVTGALGYTPARAGANNDISRLDYLSTAITGAQGGTGVANAGKTITLGGNLVTSGAYGLTITLAGTTSVSFPVTGTLLTTTGSGASLTGITAGQLSGLATVATSGSASDLGTGTLALARLPSIASLSILSNATGGSAVPAANTLTALVDGAFGSTQGSLLYRGASNWTALGPGTSGQFLQTQGAASNPQWASPAGGGTVNSATANQIAYYAGTGTAVSGSSALPNGTTATTQAAASKNTQVATNAYVDRVGIQQIVSDRSGAALTTLAVMDSDDVIPTNTEGAQFYSVTITPKSATSKLLIEVDISGSVSVLCSYVVAVFQDSTVNAIAAKVVTPPAANYHGQLTFSHEMVSGTTSATTFKVRAGPNTGSGSPMLTINGISGTRYLGGIMFSGIRVTEIGS